MRKEDERTLEQTYRSAVSGLYARLKSNYDFLYRRFGDEGIKLIAEMSREYGLSVAGRAKERLEDNSLASVTSYLLRVFDTVTRNSIYTPSVEQSEFKVVIRAQKCLLNFDKPEMCLAHTEMEKTLVEQLNPDLQYRIGKSIPAGDDCCEHIIEYKNKE